MSKQTVINRYQIGEPVASFGSAAAPIYQAFDIALNRDVWIEVYKPENHANRSFIYDWIRKQVIMNDSNLHSVYDVFDDEEKLYVVGESLRSYTTFKRYLEQAADNDFTVLKRVLKVLSIIIDVSQTLHNSYHLTLERILLNQDSVKFIPRCQTQTDVVQRGKLQPFLLLQMVLQATSKQPYIQQQVEQWLHHAERHMQMIDSVDLQLWMDALDKKEEHGPNDLERNTNPTNVKAIDTSATKLNQGLPSRSSKRSEEEESSQRAGKRSFRVVPWVVKQPMWLRVLVATCILVLIGWFGYNALNPSVVIPDLKGKSYTDAVTTLHKLGIDTSKIERIDSLGSTQKPGLIFAQDPQPGSHIRLSSSITLQVASEVSKSTVPKVVGMSINQAKEQLKQAGFADSSIQVLNGDNGSDQAIVTQVTPAAGSQVPANQVVVLATNSNTSAQASGSVVMPNLIGMSIDQASNVLLKAGLHFYYEIQTASAPSNTIYKQSIDPGQTVEKGTHVTFLVAK